MVGRLIPVMIKYGGQVLAMSVDKSKIFKIAIY
jgi:hypothetical protein